MTIQTKIVLTAAAASLAGGILLAAAGCRTERNKTLALEPVVLAAPDSDAFVGSKACAECHASEFRSHQTTRHAQTMRPANAESLGSLTPPAGRIPGSNLAVRDKGGALDLEATDSSESARIQYALGSGKTVMTYIGSIGRRHLTEFHMSYRPADRSWCITPGQQRQSGGKLGVANELGRSRRCLLCHAVKVRSDSAEPPPGFLGVGCESCHGAGRDHVQAARNQAGGNLKMERIGSWPAGRIDAMCGRCHRTADDLSSGAFEINSTARFQPYGLELSPCFKKSGGKLSCITCHDPHIDVSTDASQYERVCLNCHSAAISPSNKQCPVNPRDKCIGCHMPKEQVFPTSNLPISIADHLIWAYRKPKG